MVAVLGARDRARGIEDAQVLRDVLLSRSEGLLQFADGGTPGTTSSPRSRAPSPWASSTSWPAPARSSSPCPASCRVRRCVARNLHSRFAYSPRMGRQLDPPPALRRQTPGRRATNRRRRQHPVGEGVKAPRLGGQPRRRTSRQDLARPGATDPASRIIAVIPNARLANQSADVSGCRSSCGPAVKDGVFRDGVHVADQDQLAAVEDRRAVLALERGGGQHRARP